MAAVRGVREIKCREVGSLFVVITPATQRNTAALCAHFEEIPTSIDVKDVKCREVGRRL